MTLRTETLEACHPELIGLRYCRLARAVGIQRVRKDKRDIQAVGSRTENSSR